MIVNWSFYLGGSDTFACEIKFSVNPSNNNNNYLLVRRAPPIRLRGHILREISLTTTHYLLGFRCSANTYLEKARR